MIRCSQCGVEISGLTSNKQEWGYSLGNSMRFCTYGCMKTKQASIEAKRLETAKRKDAEKAAKKKTSRRLFPIWKIPP